VGSKGVEANINTNVAGRREADECSLSDNVADGSSDPVGARVGRGKCCLDRLDLHVGGLDTSVGPDGCRNVRAVLEHLGDLCEAERESARPWSLVNGKIE